MLSEYVLSVGCLDHDCDIFFEDFPFFGFESNDVFLELYLKFIGSLFLFALYKTIPRSQTPGKMVIEGMLSFRFVGVESVLWPLLRGTSA